jgi:hypothetical protein
VQTRFNPVAILVLPGGHLSSEHVARLEHQRLVPCVDEVLGTSEAREAAANNDHLLLVALALAGLELGRQLPTHLVVARVALELVEHARL